MIGEVIVMRVIAYIGLLYKDTHKNSSVCIFLIVYSNRRSGRVLCTDNCLRSDSMSFLVLHLYCLFLLVHFQPALYRLQIEGLPPDATSTENACLITYDHSQSWPLIVDRSGMVEAWLNCRLSNPITLKYKASLEIGRVLDFT
jgi:hypothetical protein